MALLELKNITKSFGPVQALKDVSMSVNESEVHALIGENGAGKSTLMKILSGAYQQDSGYILVNGIPYKINSPSQGRHAGIAMIYQELTLAPHLSVAENIALGIEQRVFGFMKIDKTAITKALTLLGHGNLDLNQSVKDLNIGLQQVIEIARAIYSKAKIIIMDEPTSSLSAEDTKALFQVIRRLKDKGISVIYISHFLEEVKAVADSFTVLRDGENVATGNLEETSIDQLIEHMVGRSISELFPSIPHPIGEPVLNVENLTGKESPINVSFELRQGEILGIAGLVGSGRTETIRCLFGLDKIRQGTITLCRKNKTLKQTKPTISLINSLDFLSENRKEEGLAVSMSIADNLTLSALHKYSSMSFINLKKEKEQADDYCRRMNVKYNDVNQQIENLSGGNQQKVAIARLLHHDSNIFLMDEPTRGIDVRSKSEIYRFIQALAAQGKSVIFVSSYLPELMGVCDTLAVMFKGQMSPVKPIGNWSDIEIMRYATSGVLS